MHVSQQQKNKSTFEQIPLKRVLLACILTTQTVQILSGYLSRMSRADVLTVCPQGRCRPAHLPASSQDAVKRAAWLQWLQGVLAGRERAA